MSINDALPTLVARCGDPLRTLVWLSGEHDIATQGHLSVTLARAAELADSDIVVDLSGITFMDASTIGAIIEARNHLRVGSRTLWVRDPSPRARRVLDLCGLAQLIGEPNASAPPRVVTALGTWVDVPVGDRGLSSARPAVVGASSEESVRVASRRCAEPAESTQQLRAPT